LATVTRPSTDLPDPGSPLNAEPIRDAINNTWSFLEGNNIDSGNVDYTSSDGVMVLNAAQTSTALKTFKITTNGAASVQDIGVFEWDPADASPAANQGIGFSFKMSDSANNQDEVATFEIVQTTITQSSEASDIVMSTMTGGALAERLRIDGSAAAVNIAGAAGAPAILNLQTAETTVVNGDILGRIEFQAPSEASGTDAILVAASIWAEADDTFAANNNDADLVFAVAESETAAERMRLSYDGTNVGLTFSGNTTVSTGGNTLTNSDAIQQNSTITVGANTDGHDVKFFGNASGAYLEWDESADQLRIMGASADATTSTGKLLLATSLTDINANDVLGKIDFQAPHEAGGTDAITVAASIQAIAQGTFAAESQCH
tara:strand:+ start:4759 stop:5886 length:1128 start_codon:yes stop_codon:yes gene_type:complete